MPNSARLLTLALSFVLIQSGACKSESQPPSELEKKKEKTREARDELKKLSDQARTYYAPAPSTGDAAPPSPEAKTGDAQAKLKDLSDQARTYYAPAPTGE